VQRRRFLQTSLGLGYAVANTSGRQPKDAVKSLSDNKRLCHIFNNDIDNLLYASSGKDITIEEYKRGVTAMLGGKPVVLAQNVGLPDPVIYPSKVATSLAKYIVEVSLHNWPQEGPEGATRQADALRRLEALGTDPLAITVKACHQSETVIVASYRMNAEDWYKNSWMLSDFGRAHEANLISGTGALDPAIPGVFEQRMQIFTEVAEQYGIDGIEFDFRRWT